MKSTLYFDPVTGEQIQKPKPVFVLGPDELLVVTSIRNGNTTNPLIRATTGFTKNKVQKLLRKLIAKKSIHKTGEKIGGAAVHEVGLEK